MLTYLVDEEHCWDGSQDVDYAYHASSKQRDGVVREAEILKYDRCVVDDRVNTYFLSSVPLLSKAK